MYLLDTHVCIALDQRHPAVIARFEAHAVDCYIPTLVLAELYKGVYCSQRITQNLAEVGLLSVLPFDQTAAEEFGKIQGKLRQMGKPTGEMDALIAAIALSRGDTVVTHNTRHFENIPHLLLVDWQVE